MASRLDLVEYICGQAAGAGVISHKRMFGEFGVYCDGKYVAMVCNDQFFLKPTLAVRSILPDVPEGLPYAGAKPCFLIEDIDDRDLMARLVRATCDELPAPKPKKPKKIAQ